MTVTLVFGSFIAGATSEGGGALAFPVTTLVFEIEPKVARDFSLLIQSVGMMAASFTIFCLRIPVLWPAVLYAGLGGALGVVVDLELISPLLAPLEPNCSSSASGSALPVPCYGSIVTASARYATRLTTLVPARPGSGLSAAGSAE